uniref:Uncharacterized protein n=1 Tax=Aegilops tauschii subsp. strangulata TaxID=200361 RepID=A0A453Q4F1_AEGTS
SGAAQAFVRVSTTARLCVLIDRHKPGFIPIALVRCSNNVLPSIVLFLSLSLLTCNVIQSITVYLFYVFM